MNPTENALIYFDERKLIVINTRGVLCTLYVPIRVQCVKAVDDLQASTYVFVDAIAPHSKHLMVYKIFNNWVPYYYFRINIHY